MSTLRILHLFYLTFNLVNLPSTYGLGIEFTVPAGGATWPAGPITAKWTNAGGSPGIGDLTSYSLELMIGGNTAANSLSLQSLGPNNGTGLVADETVEGTIDADVAQSIENGFYLRMTSNTTDGNSVINYSPRFTLTNMNGSTDPTYLDGANSAIGDNNVPEAQYNVFMTGASTSTPASASAGLSSESGVVTTTAARNGPSTTSSSTSTSSPQDSQEQGLSIPAIVGIAVGATICLISLAAGCLWLFYLSHQRKSRNKINVEGSDMAYLGGKAELPATVVHRDQRSGATLVGELSPEAQAFEAASSHNIPEMHGSTIVYELESDWSGWEMATPVKESQTQHYDPTQ